MTAYKQVKLAIFVSGNGSNMEAIVRACVEGRLSAEVTCVISNNPKAYALERAKRLGIPAYMTKTEEEIKTILQKNPVDLICLAGFMKILSPAFVRQYQRRILNIHPALLPQFPGLHAIRQALKAKVKETGVTVHLIDEGIDTGPIILQEKVPILETDTEESLTAKIHTVEHRLYPKAIQKIIGTLEKPLP